MHMGATSEVRMNVCMDKSWKKILVISHFALTKASLSSKFTYFC